AVADALGDSPRWFQLYWPKDPALAASLVGRAERAGFDAVVVTLDTYLLGWRERDLQLAWLPFAHGHGIANDLTAPAFRAPPAVAEAVAGRGLVLCDGGMRRGADVVKALAVGAKAVRLGRPDCWGLAVGGEQGVRDVLLNLLADFELTLGLAGCSTCAEISP